MKCTFDNTSFTDNAVPIRQSTFNFWYSRALYTFYIEAHYSTPVIDIVGKQGISNVLTIICIFYSLCIVYIPTLKYIMHARQSISVGAKVTTKITFIVESRWYHAIKIYQTRMENITISSLQGVQYFYSASIKIAGMFINTKLFIVGIE